MAAEKIAPLLGSWKCDNKRDEKIAELMDCMGEYILSKILLFYSGACLGVLFNRPTTLEVCYSGASYRM